MRSSSKEKDGGFRKTRYLNIVRTQEHNSLFKIVVILLCELKFILQLNNHRIEQMGVEIPMYSRIL